MLACKNLEVQEMRIFCVIQTQQQLMMSSTSTGFNKYSYIFFHLQIRRIFNGNRTNPIAVKYLKPCSFLWKSFLLPFISFGCIHLDNEIQLNQENCVSRICSIFYHNLENICNPTQRHVHNHPILNYPFTKNTCSI